MLRALAVVVGEGPAARVRGAFAATAGTAVLEAVGLAMLVPLVTDLLAERFPRVWLWTALLVVIVAASIVVQTIVNARRRAVTSAAVSVLQRKVTDHATTLPLGWFGPANQDRLTRLLSDAADALSLTINGVVSINLRAVALGAALWIVLAIVDLPTALVGAVGLAFVALLYRLAVRMLRGATVTGDAASDRINGQLVEFAQNQPVLRAHGRVGDANTELVDALVQVRKGASAYFRGAIVGVSAFVVGCAFFSTAVLLVAVTRAEDGATTTAAAVCVVLFSALLVDALAALGRSGSVIWAAERTLGEVEELLATPPLAVPSPPHAPPRDSSLTFDDVSFGYTRERAVLDSVSLHVPAGTTCAVVGPSGSGKTTLARLVARFWDVDAGSVCLGDVDVRDMSSDDLMSRISMVFQDVYLFDGTIRENVLVADPAADDDALARAARHARVDEIVARLPDGWDTRVGEHGAALSGGERQRVSLARAFLSDAPVVLLDEPTSALDGDSEAAVQAAIDELTRGRTVLMIAHRLGTVAGADLICFVESGRVAESGTHDALLAADGRYAAFWREQEQARTWRIGNGSAQVAG
ncbi:ABC transporter ATP-binding protein [Rhodococcus sp. HNM0569]|uniref:ABC transporter ATP-binding protein n=1 Tax=Rhodococcus sp. HNM0569 TaxID=2716340 RepID=UPI00146AD78B|nr:ABC transporter ATP-binding protein [Rhodococcus sp. HNM0569]NLU83527.1 ABC transporter ATP-binding protein [Rhodococcus sp. HNM0569]